ncbi:MAG: Mov34/MPN/PAD-1 family protein [Candidatus Micrarchaeota archaeon]|nr:Mov34/MPN/PAD-1 family protein [Candidatus Micrarchaeota archaeon]
MPVFIKKNALLSCLQGAKNLHPHEFLGLLRGLVELRGVVVTELVLAPLSDYTEQESSFSPWFLPSDPSIIGSFHSHPTYGRKPSKADLAFFSRSGRIHLIASLPYSIGSVAAYGSDGKQMELVVE